MMKKFFSNIRKKLLFKNQLATVKPSIDEYGIIKIQSVFRMYLVNKIVNKIREDINSKNNIDQENIYSIGDKILIKNGLNVLRRTIDRINYLTKKVKTIGYQELYDISNISPTYFNENYMTMKCKKPFKLKKFKRFYGAFYTDEVATRRSTDEVATESDIDKYMMDRKYYVILKLEKNMCFGPFDNLEYTLLYHDWIKLNWLINNNQWKSVKKQYTNFSFIIRNIEKNRYTKKIVDMFNEFKIFFGNKLNLSDPEKNIEIKKEKIKVKTNVKIKAKAKAKAKASIKTRKRKISTKRGKSTKNKCYVKKILKRSRDPPLYLNNHAEILKIQDNKCALCNKPININKWEWEIDHCIPWCLNGGHCPENLHAVHRECHKIKSKYIDKKFAEFVGGYVFYQDAKQYCRSLFDKYKKEIQVKKNEFQKSFMTKELEQLVQIAQHVH
jgi:5-methylcytosine-specific restriction endonuclease McrA